MKRRHKLLVVSQHFWPESFRTTDACDFLKDKGCDIEVLCGIPNYPKGIFYDGYSLFKNRRQTHNGVKIRRAFEIPRGPNNNFRIFINYISFPIFSLFHIPRLLLKKFDKIVIYQFSPVLMGVAGIIVGKIKHIETTMYVLDLWPENLYSVLPVKSRLMRKIALSISNWHYANVDKLIVLSEQMKQRLIKSPGIDPAKIIVLPQAAEKIYEEQMEDKALTKRFSHGFNILFTGNISPAQSFETVLEAAKILKAEGLKDLNWIIVGDGMSRKWLEEEVKKAGLEKSFYFEGFKPVSDIPKYTHFSDVLLGCLVKSELLEATIPAKVLSYLASGRPIVLAMDGEVRNLINNEIGCGFAGPTGDANVLAENIKKIYKLNDAERKELGKRARDYHFKHFERNLVLNKLYNFIFD